MKTLPWVLALILLAGFLLGGCSPRNEQAVSNSGILASYEGKVYYVNGVGVLGAITNRFGVTLGALCRMNEDGTNREVILPVCVASFALTSQGIYVVSSDANQNLELGSCNFNGTGYRRITDITQGVFLLEPPYAYFSRNESIVRRKLGTPFEDTVIKAYTGVAKAGSRLFYTTESALYVVDAGGSNNQLIAEGSFSLIRGEEQGAFYVNQDDGHLYWIAADTLKKEVAVYTSYAAYTPSHSGDWCLGAGDEQTLGVYSTVISTGEKTKLTDDYARNLAREGDWVYYANLSDKGFLYRVNVRTLEKQLFSATVPLNEPLFILEGWLYYVSTGEASRPYRINTATGERQCLNLEAP